jgi:hypothetical protein
MKFTILLAVVVALAVAGCGGSSDVSSSPETQTTLSIEQLKGKAASESQAAEAHLRAAMRTYNSNISRGEQVRQLKLSKAARQRASEFRQQMCELVLQDPRTPHSDRLGMIALSCE